jgi:biotin transporter BioY
VIENSPDERSLQTTSFVVHATRGVIRDQRVRRKMMLALLVGAVVLLLCGLTFLQPALAPHEHPWRVIIFWIVCIWLTLTALLLAIFDLLMVRLEARRAERALRESLRTESTRSTSKE